MNYHRYNSYREAVLRTSVQEFEQDYPLLLPVPELWPAGMI